MKGKGKQWDIEELRTRVRSEASATSAVRELYEDIELREEIIFHLKELGCEEQDALDLYQDGVIILIRQLRDDSVVIESVSSYLRGIVRYAWYNTYRRKKEVLIEDEMWDINLIRETSSFYDRIERKEMLSVIFSLISKRCQEILVASMEGYSSEQIGVMVDLTKVGHLRKEKYRCLNRIRKKILKDASLMAYFRAFL